MISFKPTQGEARLLTLDGMPGYILSERPYDLEEYVRNFTSTNPGLMPKPIKKTDQLSNFQRALDDPDHAPYTMCISSEPNDLKAKLAAATLALAGRREGLNVKWHTLVGGYRDDLRDNAKARRSAYDMLILSNIPAGGTDIKTEKLRDLLELYSHIPRIVVTTGTDPLALFNSIGFSLTYPLWIKGTRCVRAI